MKRIRILAVTHNYPRFEGDFAGIFLHLLMKKLPQFGIDPVVLAPHDSGTAEYEVIDGVKVYRFRYADSEAEQNIAYKGEMHKLVLGSVSGIFKFKRFLDRFRAAALDVAKREEIDLFAGHWLVPSGLVIKPVAKRLDLPSIMSSHGTDVRLIRKYTRTAYSYLKPFCRKLKGWTVVSNYLRDEMISVDPALERVISVTPMPHDETIFHEDESIGREPKLLVAVTRFTQQKRVDQLVKAMALLNERSVAFRLEIYGEGSLETEIRQEIERFGLDNKISIHKPIPQRELATVYNRAAIVLLNSVEEGFGLVLSEAMLCGAAVIGTDSGGIRDIIAHNERGLLVEPDNPASLAEAVESLLNDQSLSERLRKAGTQFAVRNYSSDASAAKYAEMIRRAVE